MAIQDCVARLVNVKSDCSESRLERVPLICKTIVISHSPRSVIRSATSPETFPAFRGLPTGLQNVTHWTSDLGGALPK
jgi:hypothetical protein